MINLEAKIVAWGRDKGILDKATPKDQFVKLVEEVGEIAECLSKDKPLEELELELGDLQVTLILLAALSRTSAEWSLERAYEKISGRKGKMVDGVFIKNGD